MVDLCTLTGTMKRPDGSAFGSGQLVLQAEPRDVVARGGHVTVPTRTVIETAANGQAVIALAPGLYRGQGITAAERFDFLLGVPDQATGRIEDWLGRDPEVVSNAEAARDQTLVALAAASGAAQTSTAQAIIAAAQALAAAASADAAAALALLAGLKDDTGQGIATTSVGQTFAVAVEGGITVYRHDAGGIATAFRTLPDTTRVTGIEAALGIGPRSKDFPYVAAIGDSLAQGLRKLWMTFGWRGEVGVNDLVFFRKRRGGRDFPLRLDFTDGQGRSAGGILQSGLWDILRRGERRIDTRKGDWPLRYLWALTDLMGKRAALYVLQDGTVGFVPDTKTLARIAAGIGAGTLVPALSAIPTLLIPWNVGAVWAAGSNMIRVAAERAGITRFYLGRAVAPGCFVEDGRTPIDWIAATGDSTSHGSAGDNDVVTTGTPEPNTCLMLSTGIRGVADAVFAPGAVTDFVPAEDVVGAQPHLGETGWASFGRLRAILQTGAMGLRSPCVVRTSGQGGLRLDELLSGSVFHANMLAEAARGREIALAYGRAMVCRGLWLRCGTNDRSAGRTLAAYLADLMSLQASATTGLNGVFGQTGPLDLWQSQIAAPISPNAAGIEIATAQLEAAEQNPNILLYTPEYAMPFANNVHGTAEKYAWMGELAAVADFRRQRFGATVFVPMPRRSLISVSGNVVTVPFSLVSDDAGGWHGLTFSTADRVLATQKGFRITGAAQTVTGAEIVEPNDGAGQGFIEVTLSGAPSPGATLEYATEEVVTGQNLSCAWGNLADLNPRQGALGRVLRGYSPVFRRTLA
ncbi:MAG: hypothetical protein ACT4OK_01110 [Gemmobacter sp.]